jgi:NDP-sugar pyrophosphorylase family protein
MNSVPELLVLAGGFGTRLRSAVSEVPKPLAPVCGRPYLHYLLEQWREQGVRKFTFLLHHQADQIEAFLERQGMQEKFADCAFRSVTEPQPQGTGGAIAYAVRQLGLKQPFLVANADTWLSAGIAELGTAAAPAMAIVRVADSERYGSVRTEQNRVLAFEEKRAGAGAGWINAGLYCLEPDLFRQWDGQPFSLESDMFPTLVAKRSLTAVALEAEFIDIGIPADYFAFCRWIESGKMGTLCN